jgi:hypothetical protein
MASTSEPGNHTLAALRVVRLVQLAKRYFQASGVIDAADPRNEPVVFTVQHAPRYSAGRVCVDSRGMR